MASYRSASATHCPPSRAHCSSWPAFGTCPLAGSIGVLSCSASIGSTRSEEHTSELQSHLNLVCRLLLEKKKSMQKQFIACIEYVDYIVAYDRLGNTVTRLMQPT